MFEAIEAGCWERYVVINNNEYKYCVSGMSKIPDNIDEQTSGPEPLLLDRKVRV